MKCSVVWAVFLVAATGCSAQAWDSILNSAQAIDWSDAGVGRIPQRSTQCASLTSSATVAQIDAALAACPPDQAVFLAAGTYAIDGNIHVPSNVTLRGAGASRTILNATGMSGGPVIGLGSGSVPFRPVKIVGGMMPGSKQMLVAPNSGIEPGMFLVVTETNDRDYVSSSGSDGDCNWCDGGWTKTGNLARGQIVMVTTVLNGTTVAFSPGLYASYTHSPLAVPFKMAASHAGVEDLQVRANHTGYDSDFSMAECAFCWISGVEANYTDAEFVTLTWGYHDEVRDSYFSNSYLHTPGEHDTTIRIGLKTSASLIENNIIERGHESVMLQWGAAGNVIAYNYMMGGFDSGAPNVVSGGIDFHGAHPQFNLLEGNVVASIYADPIWGTSSHTTAFRNWVAGTNRVCSPMRGRGAVACSGADGHYGFQAARAVQISYLSAKNNFVGNVIGSRQMQSLARNHKPLAQVASVEYPAERSYDEAAYAWSFGYGCASDDGTGTGCNGGKFPCHVEGTKAASLLHGNYNNIDKSVAWAAGISRVLPRSFYLPNRPAWWGTMPFPATGPDVNGGSGPGGHSYGNPAWACYVTVMGGSDGGAGGPLAFDEDRCYGTDRK